VGAASSPVILHCVRLVRLLLWPSSQLWKLTSVSGEQQRSATLLQAAGVACRSELHVAARQARLRWSSCCSTCCKAGPGSCNSQLARICCCCCELPSSVSSSGCESDNSSTCAMAEHKDCIDTGCVLAISCMQHQLCQEDPQTATASTCRTGDVGLVTAWTKYSQANTQCWMQYLSSAN
jgi:hypothetical protein